MIGARTRLLVTGFGPFPGVPHNPSATLVRAVRASAIPGVATELLDTNWSCAEDLPGLARTARTVLMLGVAAGEHRIRYERVAHRGNADRLDASGKRSVRDTPASRRSALPVAQLAAKARSAGFPVRLSHSPGLYICNASYRAALSANPRTIFVHIPQPGRRSAISQDALAAHTAWLVHELLA